MAIAVRNSSFKSQPNVYLDFTLDNLELAILHMRNTASWSQPNCFRTYRYSVHGVNKKKNNRTSQRVPCTLSTASFEHHHTVYLVQAPIQHRYTSVVDYGEAGLCCLTALNTSMHNNDYQQQSVLSLQKSKRSRINLLRCSISNSERADEINRTLAAVPSSFVRLPYGVD